MRIESECFEGFSRKETLLLGELEKKYDIEFIVRDSRESLNHLWYGEAVVYDVHERRLKKVKRDPYVDIFGAASRELLICWRFIYYVQILGLSRVLAIKRLVNCDFFLSERTIENTLGDNRNFVKRPHSYRDLKDATFALLAFDWSRKNMRAKFLKEDIKEIKTATERERALGRIITAYYYFYTSLLGFPEDEARWVIDNRDFAARKTSPHLLDIINNNGEYLDYLRRSRVTVSQLRLLYPAYAWDDRQNYLECDEDGCVKYPINIGDLYEF